MKQQYIFNIYVVLTILLFVLFLLFEVEATACVYINNVERLVKFQKAVTENITPYIDKVPEKKKIAVQKYIDLNQKENLKAMENVILFLINPANCYIIVKRLTRDLKFVEDILDQYTDYERFHSILHFPNETDFQAAAAQLLLLLQVYDVKVKDFARGIIESDLRRSLDIFIEDRRSLDIFIADRRSIDTFTIDRRSLDVFIADSIIMTSSDCFELASQAFQLKKYQVAHDWYNEAIHRYRYDCYDGGCSFTESDIFWVVKDFFL